MKSKTASQSKKNQSNKRNNKFGIVLICFLAGLILVVNVITASFSWFEPEVKHGDVINLSETSWLRTEDCVITQNFLGSVDGNNHSIVYNTEIGKTGSQSIQPNNKAYFKTVINNNSEKYPTNISLYISEFPGGAGGVNLAVTYPSNTYRTFLSKQTDLGIIRNANVTNREKGNASSGILEVEWFVDNKSSSTVNIDFSKLYLMYN